MIQVQQLTKSYGKKPVLTNISFTIEAGQCVGIAGANGCGKSTLLSILAGAQKADKGRILYRDKPMDSKTASRLIGYVPQGNPLMEELNVQDNLKLWFKGSSKQWKQELDSGIIPVLELNAALKTTAGKLSGGMKRRLSLACALMNHPAFLILDEPGAALDVVSKEEMRQYLRYYQQQGGTMLLASHEEAELSLCSRLLLMRDGSLKEAPAGMHMEQIASYIKQERDEQYG